MFQSEVKIRIRYAETDQMGYAYYGNYATYYEVARVETLRALGVPYKIMEEEGVMMPVLENYSKYIAPARYDDEITVRVFIKELPSVKIKFAYEFYNESGQLIHTGETLLIFMKTTTRKPCKVPENMLEKLKPFFDKA